MKEPAFNPKAAQLPTNKIEWGSSNLWVNIALFVGAFFAFSPELNEVAQSIILQAFSIFAGAKIIRDYFKGKPTFSLKNFGEASNSWGYLGAILTTVLPQLPVGEFIPALQQVFQAAQSGNIQQIIFSAIPVLVILYNVFFKPKTEKLEL